MPHDVTQADVWTDPIRAPSNGDTANEARENDPAEGLANRTLYNRTRHEELYAVVRSMFTGTWYATDVHIQGSGLVYWIRGNPQTDGCLASQSSIAQAGSVFLPLHIPFPKPLPSFFSGLRVKSFGMRIDPASHSVNLPETMPVISVGSYLNGYWYDYSSLTKIDDAADAAAFSASHIVQSTGLSVPLTYFLGDVGDLCIKVTGEAGTDSVANLKLLSAWVNLGFES